MEDGVVHEVFRDDGRSRSSACLDKNYGNIRCTKFIGVVALTRSFPRVLFQNGKSRLVGANFRSCHFKILPNVDVPIH